MDVATVRPGATMIQDDPTSDQPVPPGQDKPPVKEPPDAPGQPPENDPRPEGDPPPKAPRRIVRAISPCPS